MRGALLGFSQGLAGVLGAGLGLSVWVRIGARLPREVLASELGPLSLVALGWLASALLGAMAGVIGWRHVVLRFVGARR